MKTHLVHRVLSQDVLELSVWLSSSALLPSADLLHARYRSPRSCKDREITRQRFKKKSASIQVQLKVFYIPNVT